MTTKQLRIFEWTIKVLAVAMSIFGLLFYFGYGNPLPFINPAYTLFDNVWLTIFPFMFFGLILGLFKENIGAWLTIAPVSVGLIFTLVAEHEIIWPMLVPVVIGILYLYIYTHKNTTHEHA